MTLAAVWNRRAGYSSRSYKSLWDIAVPEFVASDISRLIVAFRIIEATAIGFLVLPHSGAGRQCL